MFIKLLSFCIFYCFLYLLFVKLLGLYPITLQIENVVFFDVPMTMTNSEVFRINWLLKRKQKPDVMHHIIVRVQQLNKPAVMISVTTSLMRK